MATLQDIINFLNRKYPNHGESNANIVSDLDMIHKDIYLRLQRLSNEFDIKEIESVNNQMIYNLPDGIKMADIFALKVSIDTDETEYETYRYRGIGEVLTEGRYYGRSSNGTFYIVKNRVPLNQDGLKIHIYYYKKPAELDVDDLEQVPDLDEDYHDLLKFGIVQAIASQGHNPDIEIANYYQQKFDEKFAIVSKEIESRNLSSYIGIPQQREVW